VLEGRWVVALAAMGLGMPLAAQTNAPAPAAKTAAEVSAMERAQRAAANPMRVILEAAKIKRRADADGPEPADANAVRRTAQRPAAVATAETAPVAAVVAAPAAAMAPAPAAVAPPPPAPPPSIAALPVALPAVQRVDAVSAVGTVGAPALTSLPALDARPLPDAKPKLVKMVPPEVPERVLAQLTRNEVNVDLLIRPDGTVGEVNMLAPAPRTLQRFVVEALERWTFEPLPAATVHRVQLVFSDR
jgi:hypothetical protein